jgi:hypothetical protein
VENIKDLYNPGLGLELGFKKKGIQASANYPDIIITQGLHFDPGKTKHAGRFHYDNFNSMRYFCTVEYLSTPGGDRRLPYTIRTMQKVL